MSTPLRLADVAAALRAAGVLIDVVGEGDPVIEGVSQDSRAVRAGDLFLAWRGVEADAHAFVADVARAGAVAAVVEHPVAEASIPQLVARDGRLAAALAANGCWGTRPGSCSWSP